MKNVRLEREKSQWKVYQWAGKPLWITIAGNPLKDHVERISKFSRWGRGEVEVFIHCLSSFSGWGLLPGALNNQHPRNALSSLVISGGMRKNLQEEKLGAAGTWGRNQPVPRTIPFQLPMNSEVGQWGGASTESATLTVQQGKVNWWRNGRKIKTDTL